jgi:hypothetical protein
MSFSAATPSVLDRSLPTIKQFENLEDFTGHFLASISLGDTFETLVIKLYKLVGQQENLVEPALVRLAETEEDDILDDHLKLLAPYLGPRPGRQDEDAYGFGFMAACMSPLGDMNGIDLEPINRRRALCQSCVRVADMELCGKCMENFHTFPRYEFAPVEPQGIYFDPSRNLDWMRMGLDQYLDDLNLSATQNAFEVGLNAWLATTHLTYVYEYEVCPQKDAQKNLMIMARWVAKRYEGYRQHVRTMLKQLFSFH